jgi:DNA-binding beta-propeller fold protein YncE
MRFFKHTLLPVFAVATLFMVSCKPDDDTPPTGNGTDHSKGIWVLNEGQFLAGNASLSWLSTNGQTVKLSAFEQVNGRPLGDIGQSITMIGGKAYIVVNNSGKIEVVNPTTLLSTGTITGFTSPRYIAEVAPNKAYVTDLFGGSISIVDLAAGQITGSIAAPGWTEQIMVIGNEAFVATADTNLLYVINTTTNSIVETLSLTKGMSGMTKDLDGNLWVLCNGGWNEYLPALYQIDPATHAILATYTFPSVAEDPSDLVYDSANDDLLYLNGGVFRFDLSSGALPTTAVVDAGMSYYYALALDATRGHLLVADAGDFVNPSRILRFDAASAAAIDTIGVGVAPGDFWIPN